MKKVSKINVKKIRDTYEKEYGFINDLLLKVNLPQSQSSDSESEVDEDDEVISRINQPVCLKETERAKSLTELHQRLAAIRDQKYTYKGNLKKKLENKLKRKKKQIYEKKSARNSDKKSSNGIGLDLCTKKVVSTCSSAAAVFNADRKLVFSKFDFLGAKTGDKMLKKDGSVKQAMEKLEKKKILLEKLKEKGKGDVADRIKEETKWNNALRKAEGIKVKDDESMLKKSLAKKAARKMKSEAQWKERLDHVQRQKEGKQRRRSENIANKNEQRKKFKHKNAVKKGKYIQNV